MKMHETRKMVFCHFFATGRGCRSDCDFAHGRAELAQPKRDFASAPIPWTGPLPKSDGPIPENEWQTSPWAIPRISPEGAKRREWHQLCEREFQLQRREREDREQQREANPWRNFVAKDRVRGQPAGRAAAAAPQDEQQHRVRGRHASTQTEDVAAAEAVRPPIAQQPPQPQALKKEDPPQAQALKKKAPAASSRRRSSSPRYVMPPFPKSAPTLARGDTAGKLETAFFNATAAHAKTPAG